MTDDTCLPQTVSFLRVGKRRLEIFQKACIKFGLTIVDHNQNSFILVDDELDFISANKALKSSSLLSSPIFIRTQWLSDSIKQNKLLSHQPYILNATISQPISTITETSNPTNKNEIVIERSSLKRERSISSSASDTDDEINSKKHNIDIQPIQPGELPRTAGKWLCSEASSSTPVVGNPNEKIIEKLREMSKLYLITNDKGRSIAYQKAIEALKRCTHPIRTYEEIKSLPYVKQSLADKIWEIIRTNGLVKLSAFQSRDDVATLALFAGVWGAGTETTKQWFAQGFRTLDDLRKRARLTRTQQIGLKYYNDFNTRIPRDEVTRIETIVKRTADEVVPGLMIETCGSYRRLKPSCGDIDILITFKDGKRHLHESVLAPLIDKLKDIGFLTDDLINHSETSSSSSSTGHISEQMTYFGVCRLPETGSLHRRIDLIFIPANEWACSLLYFTGSAMFNRSMRRLARRLNMSLSQHGLYHGVVRKGVEKINTGQALNTPTEESIFQYLNLPYRPPEDRDH
ncbi:unnamed protein product [Rotaria sordida]|uniref:DNA polymerase n=1 Tax=Rotaria sordida TaxID=392033 RepID=A0A813PZN3_9BILA|nr:unnamed protein product [Rotaria sordida]CAF0757782.1 unnamed protein product [Rotaria sordida]CAF0781199.1 unnamed protein product [Rotaria sordida]CAF0800973.1 unnamed protein product [Rotaria sordida]CAF3553432.1 unnamed protein product [Rotaria sordida]